MNFEAFLEKCSAPGTASDVRKAIDQGTACAWRLRGNVLEYAIADAFDPVFALLATARKSGKKISGNRERTAWGMDAKGIEKHLTTIGQRAEKDYSVSSSFPAHTGPLKRISVDSEALRSSLASCFAIPAYAGPVRDIRVETPTSRIGFGTLGASKLYAQPGTRTVPRLYMAAAFIVLRNHLKIPQGSDTSREGVAALIVDRTGAIVSWGLKNQDVDCWHGETISVLRLGGRMPEGATVFSSLKPCHMCSGVLHAASGGTVKVYWGMDDPNVNGKTCLEAESLGATLDGPKAAGHLAKALMVRKGVTPTKKVVASELMEDFKKSGQRSAINYAASSDSANAELGFVESAFREKLLSYLSREERSKQVLEKAVTLPPEAMGPEYNPNTMATLKYLNDFLRTSAKVIA